MSAKTTETTPQNMWYYTTPHIYAGLYKIQWLLKKISNLKYDNILGKKKIFGTEMFFSGNEKTILFVCVCIYTGIFTLLGASC